MKLEKVEKKGNEIIIPYEKYLLGYREVNKEFNVVEKTNAKIYVNM